MTKGQQQIAGRPLLVLIAIGVWMVAVFVNTANAHHMTLRQLLGNLFHAP